MKLEKVLEKLEKLFSKWGFMQKDWILIADYAVKLQGYGVKVRRGHFNTMIDKKKIPWNAKEGFEIFPPKNSVWSNDYIKWMKATGFETDLIVYDSKKVKKYLKYSIAYELPNKKSIYLITMEGNLIILDDYLVHCREQEAGVDKGIYLLNVIEGLQVASKEKKDKKSIILAGKILKKYEFLINKKLEKQKIFRGKIKGDGIYGGKVVGRAKLIKYRSSKYIDLKEKVILVTEMTSPDFVIIINKIKGMVTDKGGRLCHAAILAREFGIPCIIGTKMATKVINNNDLIELDADLGTVRILEKKK